MIEKLYPDMTADQKKILVSVKAAGHMTRQDIAKGPGVSQDAANNAISGLILRGALRAGPSCKVNPCSKLASHRGKCRCSDCKAV